MDILSIKPFELTYEAKKKWFIKKIIALCHHHYKNCPPYRRIISSDKNMKIEADSLKQIPYLPIQLFKSLDLKSISDQNVLKVLKSSGTSNQQPSKIYLDIETSRRQTTTMIKILQSFLGVDRKPLLIIDTASITNNKSLSKICRFSL